MKEEKRKKRMEITKKSKTAKKDENQERKILSLFKREKQVKRVILAREPMYLLMSHDYCLSSIASSLPLGVEKLLNKFGDVFLNLCLPYLRLDDSFA